MDALQKISVDRRHLNDLLLMSLKALALATFLSLIDVGSDFIQGINLCQDPELRVFGVITIAINWLPGAIAAIHLVTYQRHELGPTKTIICSGESLA